MPSEGPPPKRVPLFSETYKFSSFDTSSSKVSRTPKSTPLNISSSKAGPCRACSHARMVDLEVLKRTPSRFNVSYPKVFQTFQLQTFQLQVVPLFTFSIRPFTLRSSTIIVNIRSLTFNGSSACHTLFKCRSSSSRCATSTPASGNRSQSSVVGYFKLTTWRAIMTARRFAARWVKVSVTPGNIAKETVAGLDSHPIAVAMTIGTEVPYCSYLRESRGGRPRLQPTR